MNKKEKEKKTTFVTHPEFKYCILRDESFQQKQPNQWNTYIAPSPK